VAELRALRLGRNSGQTAALDAGFRAALGEIVVTLDADLQNDPADIPSLLRKLDEGGHLEGPPEVQTFSLGDVVVLKNHDYVPLTRDALELGIEE
jgi:glycosyltransferase involved in cell wall biosynthesis